MSARGDKAHVHARIPVDTKQKLEQMAKDDAPKGGAADMGLLLTALIEREHERREKKKRACKTCGGCGDVEGDWCTACDRPTFDTCGTCHGDGTVPSAQAAKKGGRR